LYYIPHTFVGFHRDVGDWERYVEDDGFISLNSG